MRKLIIGTLTLLVCIAAHASDAKRAPNILLVLTDDQGWDELKQNQPFFQIINSTASHESRAFGDVFHTQHDPKKTTLRKYHPDVPGMRENYAHYHDAMREMDAEIGAALKKLEEMGLAENTIVIHNSDHGGVLPRSKRYLYIRNYMPYVPWMQHLTYLWKMKASEVWEEQVRSGKASDVQSRFFKPKGWTEELYDIQNDPDNLNNLIDNPECQQIAQHMRTALRGQQERFIDSGMLPESEMVKRAADNNLTIYDMVRDPKLYPLSHLIDAADLALEEDPANLPRLNKLLSSPESGLRYWGIVGCFLLNDQDAALQSINDASHEVRAMAAWLLIRTGGKNKGLQCLEDLLEQNSYATLTILNRIDWMGDDGQSLLPTVQSLSPKNVDQKRMRQYLVQKKS